MKEIANNCEQKRGFQGFLKDEHGQALTEYILIVGLVVLPIVIAFNRLQNPIKTLLERVAKYFEGPGV